MILELDPSSLRSSTKLHLNLHPSCPGLADKIVRMTIGLMIGQHLKIGAEKKFADISDEPTVEGEFPIQPVAVGDLLQCGHTGLGFSHRFQYGLGCLPPTVSCRCLYRRLRLFNPRTHALPSMMRTVSRV